MLLKREILFRAKRVDNGDWVYGGFTLDAIGQPRITVKDSSGKGLEFIKVIPETVGQFTGLTDKNGTKIFEGDRYKTDSWPKVEYTVKFLGGSFCGGTDENGYDPLGFSIHQDSEAIELDYFASNIKITGTIHDNPTP